MLPYSELMEETYVPLSAIEERDKTRNKTFRLNNENNALSGAIDGLEAVTQSIRLRLSIEADQFIIYPYTYGLKTLDLYGESADYVITVLPGRIKKTLLKDNRVIDVTDFYFDVVRNTVYVEFVVKTIYGNVKTETAVKF